MRLEVQARKEEDKRRERYARDNMNQFRGFVDGLGRGGGSGGGG